MAKETVNQKPDRVRCSTCSSGQVYFRQTSKDYVCRLGHTFTLEQKRATTTKNKEKSNVAAGRTPRA